MKKYLLSYQYMKKYTKNIVFVAAINLISCVFEGFSITMLIPVLQNLMFKQKESLHNIPFLNKISFLLDGKTPYEVLPILIIFTLVAIVLKNIFFYISMVLVGKLRYDSMGEFRSNLLDKILYSSNKYYDLVKSGHLVSNINYETSRMGTFINALLNILVLGVKIIIYVIVLLCVSWKGTICIFILMIVVFPLIRFIIKKVKILGDESSSAASKFNFILLEILSGIRVIKSFGTENYEKKKFKNADDDYINSNYKYEKYNALIAPFTETIVLTLIVFVFFVFMKFVNLDITQLIPYAIVYVVLLNRTMNQINVFNIYGAQLANNLSSFDSYKKVEDGADEFKTISGNKVIQKFEKNIEFKNVNFSYINRREVLKNINIKIQKGKITAIVGATGSGKSTMVNLIPRFYDVTSGEITVDAIPINDLELHNWRRKIGIVSQDVFIFNTTIRENILYGNFNVSDLEVERAAKIANAHEFIMEMTDGYNTIVGERGMRLSGGEKQRISIARAIISNPEILILDEATSAMDTKTERLIQEAIDKLTQGRTVIAIAHRLSTIQNADEIIVLEGGEVVEKGKHAELMQNSSHYKVFYDLQYRRKDTNV